MLTQCCILSAELSPCSAEASAQRNQAAGAYASLDTLMHSSGISCCIKPRGTTAAAKVLPFFLDATGCCLLLKKIGLCPEPCTYASLQLCQSALHASSDICLAPKQRKAFVVAGSLVKERSGFWCSQNVCHRSCSACREEPLLWPSSVRVNVPASSAYARPPLKLNSTESLGLVGRR